MEMDYLNWNYVFCLFNKVDDTDNRFYNKIRFGENLLFDQNLVDLLILKLILGQMFLMDRFFDGAFLTFGLEVIAFAEQDQEDRLDPLIYVFPRMTKV